jgi:hypothetical protein
MSGWDEADAAASREPAAADAGPAASDGKRWSSYQEAIFDAVERGDRNLMVIARAGSGKTTSLIKSIDGVSPTCRTLLCAFNRSIKAELERRAPSFVTVSTLHGAGLRQVMKNMRRFHNVDPDDDKGQVVDDRKGYALSAAAVDEAVGESDPKRKRELRKRATDLSRLCREGLVLESDLPAIQVACERYALDDQEYPTDVLARVASKIMVASLEHPRHVDYPDMVWFPWRFGYGTTSGTTVDRYDWVFVDEMQDMGIGQIDLALRMRRGGSRVVGLGDPAQGIYGWRGADASSMARLGELLGAQELSLPISYRCPVAVVELAQTVVPDIQPAPGAQRGEVLHCSYERALEQARPGDFILSRSNAPLMRTCLKLLKRGQAATIAGRDIGRSLLSLMDQSKTRSLDQLDDWLHKYIAAEEEKYGEERPGRVQFQKDRVEALRCLMQDCKSFGDVQGRIETIYPEEPDPKRQIVLSTVHKAKGLERERVWMIEATFGRGGMEGEEANIWYVAVTRSQRFLGRIDTPIEEIMGWKRRDG